MKKIFLTAALWIGLTSQLLAQSGGPDAYGYTWTSSGAGGVAYNWIDISGLPGVQTVTGLADDNSAPAMINLGFDFQYYWSSFNQMKVGSNGWLSFDNVSNIASCFPGIPSPGGAGDNFLAPYMSDLNFTGVGNPGQVQYWSDGVAELIISYTNVPFWSASAPGYVGNNSFQVILSAADSSITYQYMNVSAFTNGASCNDMVIGIENLTGSIGLQSYLDAMVPTNFAIRYDPPNVPLISVPDVQAKWNQNINNKANFTAVGTPQSVQSDIKNAGNVDLTTSTTVNQVVTNVATTATVLNVNTSVATLLLGQEELVTSSLWTPTSAGGYSLSTQLTNSADINATNNNKVTEVVAIDACATTSSLSYLANSIPNTSSINWNGGAIDDGVAVYFEPPLYPYFVNQVECYITANTSDGFDIKVYDDDGPNGGPGTILFAQNVPSGSVTAAAWNTVTIPGGINLMDGGYYVAWFQGGSTIFLGTSTVGPFSNQNYEILDNGWAAFRYNSTQDAGIRSTITLTTLISADFTAATNGLDVQFTNMSIGNPSTYTWDFGDGSGAINANPLQTYINSGTYVVCLTVTNNCGGVSTYCDTITVCDAIIPSTQPTDLNLCDQAAAQFAVVSGADNFEWQENSGSGYVSIINGGIYSGANTSTLSISTVNPAMNNYMYRCILTNTCGDSIGTSEVTLYVDAVPTVSFGALDTVCDNDQAFALTGGMPTGGTYSGAGVNGGQFDPVAVGAGSYVITYTVPGTNGCDGSAQQTIVVDGCSGIQELTSTYFNVYPNPTNGLVTIRSIEGKAFSYEVIGLDGRTIKELSEVTSQQEELNLLKESKGIYVLNIYQEGSKHSIRLVID